MWADKGSVTSEIASGGKEIEKGGNYYLLVTNESNNRYDRNEDSIIPMTFEQRYQK